MEYSLNWEIIMPIGPSTRVTADFWKDESIPCKKKRIKLSHQFVHYKNGKTEYVDISPFIKIGLQFGRANNRIFFKHPKYGWREI